MDEQALLELARKGDLDSFNRLILMHQSQAFNLACRMLGEESSAEDSVQQAFLSAYRHLGDLRGESFRAWLMRITANACLDELRRRKRKPTLSVEELGARGDPDDGDGDPDSLAILADPAEGPESSAVRAELRAAIERCLQQLPDEMRATVLLADVQALAYEEVAATLRIAVGTVKSRVARARAGLRDCLRRKNAELLPAAYRLNSEARA